jgi:hypothetical protein
VGTRLTALLQEGGNKAHCTTSEGWEQGSLHYIRRVGTRLTALLQEGENNGWGGYLTAGRKDGRNLRSRGFGNREIDGETWLLGDLHEVEIAFK